MGRRHPTPSRPSPARWWLVALALFIAAAATACGSGSSDAVGGTSATTTSPVRLAADRPSKAARLVCSREAREDLAGVLAAKPTQVTEPTWSDDLYTCNYVYADGTVTLSVKQLEDDPTTTAYFDMLGTSLGRLPDDIHLAQGAFQAPDGSMVVRKDHTVLRVDVSHLPSGLDKGRLSAADVASAFAVTILQCWKG